METKKFLPLDTLLLLYYVLIQAHILYAIIIWGSTCSTYKNRLRTLQNNAIKSHSESPNSAKNFAKLS